MTRASQDRSSIERKAREAACYEASFRQMSVCKGQQRSCPPAGLMLTVIVADPLPLYFPEKSPVDEVISSHGPASIFVPADAGGTLMTPRVDEDMISSNADTLDKVPLSPSRHKADRRRSLRQALIRLTQELADGPVYEAGALDKAAFPSPTDCPRDETKGPGTKPHSRAFALGKAFKSFRRTLDPRPPYPLPSPTPSHSRSFSDGSVIIQLTPELLDALEASDESEGYSDDDDGGDEDSCHLGTAILPV